MASFARGTLTAFRNDPLNLVLAVDYDLTGVPLSFAVRLVAGAGGAPVLLLTSGAGITIEGVVDNGDGTSSCLIVLSKDKAAWQAAVAPYISPEPGTPAKLAWDLQWTPPAELVGDFADVESTLAIGDLIILESCNG